MSRRKGYAPPAGPALLVMPEEDLFGFFGSWELAGRVAARAAALFAEEDLVAGDAPTDARTQDPTVAPSQAPRGVAA